MCVTWRSHSVTFWAALASSPRPLTACIVERPAEELHPSLGPGGKGEFWFRLLSPDGAATWYSLLVPSEPSGTSLVPPRGKGRSAPGNYRSSQVTYRSRLTRQRSLLASPREIFENVELDLLPFQLFAQVHCSRGARHTHAIRTPYVRHARQRRPGMALPLFTAH